MRPSFTLIETMLAVLLMALLAAAVSLSVDRPVQAARGRDAVDLIAGFDAAARQAAVQSGRRVRVQFDLSAGTIVRLDGTTPAARATLPTGYRVVAVRVGRQVQSTGTVPVDVAAHGWSRSYAVHVVGPAVDAWVAVAGLTGQSTEVADEAALPIPPPGYDAD